MAENNVASLNKAINVAKTSINDFAGGVDNLASKFDRLAQTLRISTYVELNSTYTKLARNLALNAVEAEKLSKTVELLAKRTDTYSKQQLANMSAMLYKSTGAITIFKGEFDKLTERFAGKYKKDAEAYVQTLTRLTEQMPEVAYAMRRGQSDFATLAEIMRTSGREGVSAYLAAIDKIPDETENSINRTEIQITRLQKIWADAKVALGRTLSTLYSPLAQAGTAAGGFAEQNPALAGILGATASAGGTALSSFGPMIAQTLLLKNALGGGAKASGGISTSNLFMPSASNLVRHQGFAIAPSSNMPQFAGWGQAALGVGAGMAAFGGGHALNDKYNGGGVWGQFGTNMLAGGLAGSSFGPAGAAIGVGVGAVGTVITELISVIRENTEALEEKERIEREFRTDRFLAKSKSEGYEKASLAVLSLSSKASYGEQAQAYINKAKEAKEQLDKDAKAIEEEILRKASMEAKKKQLEDNKPQGDVSAPFKYGGGNIMQEHLKALEEHRKAVLDLTKSIADAEKNIEATNQRITQTRSEAAEALMQARIAAERDITVSSALIGQTEQAMQLSIQYGGANVPGADPEKLKLDLKRKVLSLENKLKTVSDLTPEDIATTEREIQITKFALAFDPAERRAQRGFAAAALGYRSSMAETGLKGAQGSLSFEEFVGGRKTAELSQISEQIRERELQLKSIDFSQFGEAAEQKRVEIESEIKELKIKGIQEAAKAQTILLEGAKAELQTRESIMKTYDVKSTELILKLQKEQLENAKKIMEQEIKINPERKAQLEAQFRAQAEAVKYYEQYGKKQIEAEQAGQILQMERGAYGVTGAGTKGLQLELDLVKAKSVLASKRPEDEAGIKLAQALVNQLTIQKQINEEIEKRSEINQFDLSITDKQIQRMQTLRAPVGIIASLNRQKLQQNKEALVIAERELEIARQSKDPQAARVAQQKVEDVKNAIASSIDFERRTYAEMFTETTFGKLGGGSYLFPGDVSKFATMGSGYTTGQSGYGQKGGTYQTQISQMFGAGVDERTSIEKLYGSLVNDGIKLQDGATFKIVGMDGGVATLTKEADRP